MHLSASHCDLSRLTLNEKIGQLFIVPSYPSDAEAEMEGQPAENRKYVQDLILRYHIGGVLLKHYWKVEDQQKWVRKMQKLAHVPLFVVQDCECGIGMRLKEVTKLPKNGALGTILDTLWHHLVGREIGRQCRVMGVNFALAPVADINTNPLNPIISARSFGCDPHEVAARVEAVVKGIQKEGVLACAKHFPGHGDTEVDSHLTLPVLKHSWDRLNEVELIPFKLACHAEVKSIMTGHLLVEILDYQPASLSKKAVQKLLREDFGYEGLVITDDLLMGAVCDIDDLVLKVFQSGTDLILSAPDIPAGIAALKKSLKNGDITEDQIDDRVQRILRAKNWMAKEFYDEALNPKVKALNSKLKNLINHQNPLRP